MKVALPTDNSWNAFENSYEKKAYERICDEFGVSVHTNWRQEKTSIKGLVLCITIGQWIDTIHSRGQNMIKKIFIYTDYNKYIITH